MVSANVLLVNPNPGHCVVMGKYMHGDTTHGKSVSHDSMQANDQ